jgi:hypothetical protein
MAKRNPLGVISLNVQFSELYQKDINCRKGDILSSKMSSECKIILISGTPGANSLLLLHKIIIQNLKRIIGRLS